MIEIERSRRAPYLTTCRVLAVLSAIAAAFYLKWLIVDAQADNVILFNLLVGAEIFNVIQALGFWYTISTQKWIEPAVPAFTRTLETVDVFITVFGEPVEIVELTVVGALSIRHPRKAVWILDDGPSDEIRDLANRLGAGYLTRPDRRGAKAGNLNEALKSTLGDFVLILDADHVPCPEFFEKTMGAFQDLTVSFVQTPQVYSNKATNRVAAGANDQQGLFYGPILRGKNASGAVFSCGTNVVFRRSAFDAVGGMPEDSITEDLRVSLLLKRAGYRSVYVPIVLATGMGPVDVRGYFSQQFRWARGGLEILFRRKPYFRGMGVGATLQYSLGFVYWFTGWAYAAYLVLPVAFLVFGERPVQVPNQYPIYFLPYITATLVTLAYAADFKLSFSALWFTLGSFPVHIRAFFSAVVGRKARFVVTSKVRSRRSLLPVTIHMLVIAVLAGSIAYGVATRGFTPSVMNNVAFALGHILIVQGFVRYAFRSDALQMTEEEPVVARPRAIAQAVTGTFVEPVDGDGG